MSSQVASLTSFLKKSMNQKRGAHISKKKFNSKKVIIDASSAHRVSKGWEYGFPELYKNKRKLIKGSNRISNPGCYPTGALSLIRPLVENNFIDKSLLITIGNVMPYFF